MIIKKIAIGFLVALLAIPVLFQLAFVTSYIYSDYVESKAVYPHEYPNSEWISEDGTVSLKFGNYDGDGTVNIGSESFRISIAANRGGNLYASEYYSEEAHGPTIQRWKIKSINESEFTVKVKQIHDDITIFEDGATITFYRVDTPSQTE